MTFQTSVSGWERRGRRPLQEGKWRRHHGVSVPMCRRWPEGGGGGCGGVKLVDSGGYWWLKEEDDDSLRADTRPKSRVGQRPDGPHRLGGTNEARPVRLG
jgi:hypothetical protein